MEQITKQYVNLENLHPETIVRGKRHKKSTEQKYYDKLVEYTEKLMNYAEYINICGDSRNSYSKTDTGSTFFRMKRDYMGNDQLLPGYNIQLVLCDEYISVFNVKQYASDTDCFQLLMEKYMKFTMFKKETEDTKYRDNPYRAVDFPINEKGNPVCPDGKEFHFLYIQAVKNNKYGRREKVYQCEDCSNCYHKEICTKAEGDRTIRLNEKLTVYHQEVLNNLNSTKCEFLRMNRSI